jgi:Contractile injection system tube protein
MALVKLKIISYSDDAFSSDEQTYEAMINPPSYDLNLGFDYSSNTPVNSVETLSFKAIPPPTLALTFVFDGTKTVSTLTTAQKNKSVNTQLTEFQSHVYKYDGTKHNPRFLKILWGPLEFKCVMTTLKISFKLFGSDGYPLRAKADANFKHFLKAETAMSKLDKNSPDLTHIRSVVAGDSLPTLTQTIYDDWTRYLEVARINGLDHFREVEPGNTILFPPIS